MERMLVKQENRVTGWKRPSGYIWAMIGSAVGFANILGFSSQCYFHGGGAFLLPFSLAFIFLGIPFLILEGIVGQKFSLPIVSSSGKVLGKKGKIFGWLATIACLTIGAFYIILTGWSAAYTYFAASNSIPLDTLTFFKVTFLKNSGSLTNWGSFSVTVFLFTILVGLFSWFVISRNIRSGIEKICSIFLPLLTLLVVFFAVAVCFLPGALEGFKNYLMPNFSRLLDPKIWRDTFGHLFFSLSLGLGIVTAYSRHTTKAINIPRAMMLVALGDFFISFIAGFAIFGCIGYMSHLSGKPFSNLINPDSIFEIGFIVFPMILKTFGPLLARILGVVFFFSVFIAGVTGVFSIIECISGNIEVEFGKKRTFAVTLAILLTGILFIPFCFGNGQHIIGALSPMVIGMNMLFGGLVEIIVFLYISKKISRDAVWGNSGKKTFAYLSLKYVVPFILIAILAASIVTEIKSGFGYPEIVRWSWFAIAVAVSAILSYSAPLAAGKR